MAPSMGYESVASRSLGDLPEMTEFPSRLVTIPIWYDDPWSRACAEAHGVGDNVTYLAETHGITPEEVIAIHSGVTHWVPAVGFPPSPYQAVQDLAKIATVISPDLSRLAQLRPGDPVRFRAVDPDEAHDLYVACCAVGGGAELA